MIFEQGQLLGAIFFDNGHTIKVGDNCDSIIVSMENGQMAGVPWFEVRVNDSLVCKYNAALCKGVLYKD